MIFAAIQHRVVLAQKWHRLFGIGAIVVPLRDNGCLSGVVAPTYEGTAEK